MDSDSAYLKCILVNCEHYLNWHKEDNKYDKTAQARLCGYYAFNANLNCHRWRNLDPFRLLIAQRREERKRGTMNG